MDTSGLLDYQCPSVVALLAALRRYGAALDASETGTGKTYVAMGVARELGLAPVVICPKAVRSAWHRVAAHLGGECYTINYEKLRTGKTEWGTWEHVRWQEKLHWDAKTGQTTPVREEIRRFVFDSAIPLIIWDECHRCKGKPGGKNTQNAQMMAAAGRQAIPSLALSATIAQSPLDMKAVGFLLKLHDGSSDARVSTRGSLTTNFFKFCKIFGCQHEDPKNPRTRLVFHGANNALTRLHENLFPARGVRTTRDELGDAFPDCQITAELYDLPEADELEALYSEMKDALDRLKEKEESDKDLEHPLTQLLRARQKVEILKVPLFEELVREAIDNGMRPVVFVNFNETIDALIKRLGKDFRLSVIRGQQLDTERDKAIDDFQSNVSEITLANIDAGGIGISLHDTDGRFPRISYISPCLSALKLIQALGRIWRQNGKSKALQRVVLAAGTVEHKIQKNLEKKLDNISLINDGDLSDLFSP